MNFNGLSTHLWLFYAYRLGNLIHIHLLYIDRRPGRAVKIGNAPAQITGVSGRGISGYYDLDRGQVEWVRNCDAHKKKVDVELLYNSVKTGGQLVWRPDQLEKDAVEKASTQQREPSGHRLSSWGPDELEVRCSRENQHPERLGPPVEQPRRTEKKRGYGQ